MKTVFVFEKVAVIVMPWWEPMDPPERGTRVEVRLLEDSEKRGSRFASQRIVLDRPVFRADLFDQITGPPGNLQSAHFHPMFNGYEPCKRNWDPAIKADPVEWLRGELGDLLGLLGRAGVEPSADERAQFTDDAKAVADALPAIVASVESSWEFARSR